MSRYEFVSPGAEAGQSIDKILVRNKLEARQRLLDSINQRNVDSEIRYRDENAKSLAEEREGQKAYRAAETKALGDKQAALEQARTGNKQFIADHPDIDPKIKAMLQFADATGDTELFKTVVSRYLTPEKSDPQHEWHEIMDWNGRGTGNWAEGPTHFLTRPPNEPRQSYTAPGLTTTDGRLITVIDGVPHAINPKTLKNEVYSGTVGAKPVASSNSGKINYAPFKDLPKLRAKAVPTTGFFGQNVEPDPKDSAAWDQGVRQAIGTYPTSQNVRDTAIDIMTGTKPDPKDPTKTVPVVPQGLGVDEIINNHVDQSGFDSPEELDQLRNLLGLLPR